MAAGRVVWQFLVFFLGPLLCRLRFGFAGANRAGVGAYLDDAAVGGEAGGACLRFVGAWTMRQRGFSGGGEARIPGTRASPEVEVQTREEVKSAPRAGKQKKMERSPCDPRAKPEPAAEPSSRPKAGLAPGTDVIETNLTARGRCTCVCAGARVSAASFGRRVGAGRVQL